REARGQGRSRPEVPGYDRAGLGCGAVGAQAPRPRGGRRGRAGALREALPADRTGGAEDEAGRAGNDDADRTGFADADRDGGVATSEGKTGRASYGARPVAALVL